MHLHHLTRKNVNGMMNLFTRMLIWKKMCLQKREEYSRRRHLRCHGAIPFPFQKTMLLGISIQPRRRCFFPQQTNATCQPWRRKKRKTHQQKDFGLAAMAAERAAAGANNRSAGDRRATAAAHAAAGGGDSDGAAVHGRGANPPPPPV